MNQFSWLVARRYFFAKRSNKFISWVGGVSILGIALGVIALIITLAVLNGFESEVTRRIINFVPHIIVRGAVPLQDLRQNLPATARVYRSLERKAILTALDDQMVLNVRAIEESVWDYDLVEQSLQSGLPGRLPQGDQDFPGIVIGAAIADKFFLTCGDTVAINSPLDISPGLVRIPQRHFIVTGIFQSDIFDFDRSLAIISFAEGRRLFKAAGAEEIHVQLPDFNTAGQVKDQLAQKYPELSIATWYDQNKTLFDAMRMEKWGSFIGLNLIILVAVFNIVSSLMMLVLEKTGDIGILRVLGARSGRVKQIFNIQGLLVAIMGVALGMLIGVSLVLSQAYWGWIQLPSEIYLIPVLPVKLYPTEVLIVGIVAFAIVLLSVNYPARKAAALRPLEAINYKR